MQILPIITEYQKTAWKDTKTINDRCPPQALQSLMWGGRIRGALSSYAIKIIHLWRTSSLTPFISHPAFLAGWELKGSTIAGWSRLINLKLNNTGGLWMELIKSAIISSALRHGLFEDPSLYPQLCWWLLIGKELFLISSPKFVVDLNKMNPWY